jgi:hypothetical protein
VPDIRVVQPHSLPVDQVKSRLGGFSDRLAKYGVRLDWQDKRAQLRGVPGVGGHVEIRPNELEVFVSLSRMVTMMGLDPKKLEGTIRRRLDEALR